MCFPQDNFRFSDALLTLDALQQITWPIVDQVLKFQKAFLPGGFSEMVWY